MRLVSLICITALLFSANLTAKSILLNKKYFSSIQALIAKDKQPTHTLLVLDNDDTLTTMPCSSAKHCQYLGGPSWYTWQSQLPPNSPYRVANNTGDLLAINTLILDMTKMPLVESNIPAVLKLAKQRGIRLLIATARGYDMLSATESQLKQDHVLKLIESDAVKTPTGAISFAGPYMPKNGKRLVVYQNGILYLAGQNKGLMLKAFLQKTQLTHKITRIIFVDDTLENNQQMADAYGQDSAVTVNNIHYTHLAARQMNFLSGKNAPALQARANLRWKHIKAALNHHLPGFKLGQ